MKIISGVDSELTGGDGVTPLEFNATKIVNSSTNLFYDVVPFEMLRSYETQPQVIVNVGEYPAICKNLTCDYHYIVP